MHKSRLAGFIVDCEGGEVGTAARFWSQALGMAARAPEGTRYVPLDGTALDLAIEVQRVEHPSRLHLDIETDDVDAEVARLEALGAKRIEKVRTFWVMEAPTGHRFCVVKTSSFEGRAGVNSWG